MRSRSAIGAFCDSEFGGLFLVGMCRRGWGLNVINPSPALPSPLPGSLFPSPSISLSLPLSLPLSPAHPARAALHVSSYLMLSLLVSGATALSTASLLHVSYTTKVAFKSAKLVPTMVCMPWPSL